MIQSIYRWHCVKINFISCCAHKSKIKISGLVVFLFGFYLKKILSVAYKNRNVDELFVNKKKIKINKHTFNRKEYGIPWKC